MMGRKIWQLILLLGATLWLAGCQTPVDHKPVPTASTATTHHYGRLGDPGQVKTALMQQYKNWHGVPYRAGGDSRRGVDCSGFVKLTFRDQFGIDLPRDTGGMGHLGQAVSSQRLQPGDLVFFQTGRRTRHVGIFLQNGRFLHASTSKGVIISDMNTPYWRNAYVQSRRI